MIASSYAFLVDTLSWLLLTVMAYVIALMLYKKTKGFPLFLPVLFAVWIVLAVLWLFNVDYTTYQRGNETIIGLISPVTVALAVPLYYQLPRLKAVFWPVVLALGAGATAAVVTTAVVAWVLGATDTIRVSMVSKSLTMPIAMDVAGSLGGIPALASIGVALTGILGSIVSGVLFRSTRIHDTRAIGFSLGLTAHAIGVARALQINETAGAFAALAMGLHGILGAIVIPVLWVWWVV